MSDIRATAPYSGAPEHAYDPDAQPEYFEGVLGRRVIAFLIDVLVIVTPVVIAAILVLILGVLTLGLGWLLYFLFPVATLIWAAVYYGLCMASPASATLGMRAVGLEMRTWYGAPGYFLLGAVHAVLYWVLVSSLTPLVLLVALLNRRRRLLHDMLLGTIVVNSEARAHALRQGWRG